MLPTGNVNFGVLHGGSLGPKMLLMKIGHLLWTYIILFKSTRGVLSTAVEIVYPPANEASIRERHRLTLVTTMMTKPVHQKPREPPSLVVLEKGAKKRSAREGARNFSSRVLP